MSIQYDIADVLEEVGLSFTVERLGVVIEEVTEYLTYTPNSQVTKPFIREHFLEVAFKSSTVVQTGDVITFVQSGDSYLVVNNTPDFFEDEIIRYLAVLYKTNVLVDILRPQNTTVNYHTSFSFTTLFSAQKVLIYAPMFGNASEVDADIGIFTQSKQELYLPVGYGVRVGDRISIPATSEYYTIAVTIPRRYPNICYAELAEDTREG
jgi:hypothetical protein